MAGVGKSYHGDDEKEQTMNDLRSTDELLDPERGCLTFEELKRENGLVYWLASELMTRLGYDIHKPAFFNAIKRTINAILALNIDALDNINKFTHDIDGKPFDDYKLSRFASYILVMNANPKKPEVAKAQAYFVAMTHQMEMLMNDLTRFGKLADFAFDCQTMEEFAEAVK